MQIGALTQPTDPPISDARLDRIRRAEANAEDDQVAREVEGLFTQILVKELRKGLGDGFFGQGVGADTFEGWLDDHLGESLAKDGVLDLAGMIKTNLAERRERAAEAEAQQSEG
jgi:Rod binding domain-containing protein